MHLVEIDPEIANRLAGCSGEPTDKRDRDGNTGCRRNEVLHGQAGHLHEVGHRAFAAVVLPVGIGHEADVAVLKASPGSIAVITGRIIGRIPGTAARNRERRKPAKLKNSIAARISGPMLFFPLIGSGNAVEASLNWNEDGRKKCAFAVENTRHVAAERLHEQNDDPAEDEDLYPTVESHRINFPALCP